MLSFLGIGAQKAGTTWLYEMLAQHPDIYFPGGKERHFWNAHYNGANVQDYLNSFDRPRLCGGDITPAYGHLPVETIQAIHAHCPDLKLIYIIRNPIERAWSAALMALKRAEMEFEEASDQWFIDHFNSKGSLQRGDYEAAIRNWSAVFGWGQLLVLRYEDIAEAPTDLLGRCCGHLGVQSFKQAQLNHMKLERKVFAGIKAEIRPALQRELVVLYGQKISALDDYLSDFSLFE